MTGVRWCRDRDKCCGRYRGSRERKQLSLYSLAVTVALTGGARCPHCASPVWVGEGNGETDRTRPGCYLPGYVVRVCRPCNNGLGQGFPIDRERYIADVLRVSLTVPILSPTDAARQYDAMTRDVFTSLRQSPYAV